MRSKIFPLVLFCALFFVAQAQAQMFHPETATLKNGLQIVVLPNHRAPVVTQMIWYKAGAMDDPWGSSGIAHFLEHLAFKGTKLHPDGDYARIISRMGGEQNAFTNQDYTAYYATFGRDRLETVMALEADRMAHWDVTEDQVKHERDVIIKERQQRTENDPVAAFFEQVNALLYTNYPYQRPPIGWRSEIEKLSRDDAWAFHKAHYGPNNAIVVISGDATLKDILPLAEKYYGSLQSQPVIPRRLGDAVELEGNRRIEGTSPQVRETIWSRHRLVKPARPQNIGDSDARRVLEKILGDGRIGRLYRRLVVADKIATSASISYEADGIGLQRFALVATPEPGVPIEKIEAAIDIEIWKILAEGVSEEEVKKATRALETETIYQRDSVMGPAMVVGNALTSGLDLATVEAWPQRMRNVTAQAVNKAAKEIFDNKEVWVTAILRPQTEAQP